MEEKSSDKEVKDLLLQRLIKLQEKEGHISEDKLKKVSEETNIPVTKVYEVATFYSFLSTEKKGKHVIRLCNSPSCYLNGSESIIEIFEKELGIKAGETTEDGKVTLELTSCIGCCDKAPACLINNTPYTNLDEEKIKEILKKCR